MSVYCFSNTNDGSLLLIGTEGDVNYLCNFAVRDIKIAVCLESPRKINFNLVSDFFSKVNFSKNGL